MKIFTPSRLVWIVLKIAVIAAALPAALSVLFLAISIVDGLIMLHMGKCLNFSACSIEYLTLMWNVKVLKILLMTWCVFFGLLSWHAYKRLS